jgi:hypothetical protein
VALGSQTLGLEPGRLTRDRALGIEECGIGRLGVEVQRLGRRAQCSEGVERRSIASELRSDRACGPSPHVVGERGHRGDVAREVGQVEVREPHGADLVDD